MRVRTIVSKHESPLGHLTAWIRVKKLTYRKYIFIIFMGTLAAAARGLIRGNIRGNKWDSPQDYCHTNINRREPMEGGGVKGDDTWGKLKI